MTEATTPEELHLERMSWPDVRAALDAGATTVVFACGAVEQHGPHLPLCVDAERGTRLAEAVARRLGGALVAPTIRVGCSEHHMAFPGTISLRTETLKAVLADYCASLARHGFRRLCIIPSHGGNYRPLAEALPDLRTAAGTDARVLAYTDLDAFIAIWRDTVQEATGLGDRVRGHADIAESSVFAALHPDLVRPDRAAAGYTGELSPELLDRVFRDGFASVSENGILGDARGLDADLGERIIAAVADALATAFRGMGETGS